MASKTSPKTGAAKPKATQTKATPMMPRIPAVDMKQFGKSGNKTYTMIAIQPDALDTPAKREKFKNRIRRD